MEQHSIYHKTEVVKSENGWTLHPKRRDHAVCGGGGGSGGSLRSNGSSLSLILDFSSFPPNRSFRTNPLGVRCGGGGIVKQRPKEESDGGKRLSSSDGRFGLATVTAVAEGKSPSGVAKRDDGDRDSDSGGGDRGGGGGGGGKFVLALLPRRDLAALSYATAASSGESKVPSQTRVFFHGSLISAAYLPHGLFRTPL